MSDTREIDSCRLCGGKDLHEYIDFGAVALGNNLQEDPVDARAAAQYPLGLNRCGACGHFQLTQAVDPKILYATNYTYLSGISESFVRHFQGYAAWAEETCSLPAGSLVVDVGSNDGSCLKAFQDRGHKVCGVDPASMPADIANANGIDTINAFFNDEAAAEIKARYGLADYVTSHNVLAHVDDLAATFRTIRDLLKPGGYFGFEVGYFREVLRTGCFDTIYHEHLDYHHAAPLVRYLTALGFSIVDLSVNAIQGGSIRVLCRKDEDGSVSPAAKAFLDEEAGSVLNDEAFLSRWREKIEAGMAQFHQLLRDRADSGASIAAYGAPTKATLLMKMAGIGGDEIAYVVDDNKLKAGRYFPSSGVPIMPTAHLMAEPADVLIIFAWNFADDIIAKIKGKFDKPVDVVVPLPELRTVRI